MLLATRVQFKISIDSNITVILTVQVNDLHATILLMGKKKKSIIIIVVILYISLMNIFLYSTTIGSVTIGRDRLPSADQVHDAVCKLTFSKRVVFWFSGFFCFVPFWFTHAIG